MTSITTLLTPLTSLTILFEHNLNGFVVERGMRKARKILERIRNKAILAGFDHWVKWNIKAREEEKEEEMRQFALAHGQEKLKQFLLNFLHNKISGGFKKWRHFVELCLRILPDGLSFIFWCFFVINFRGPSGIHQNPHLICFC